MMAFTEKLRCAISRRNTNRSNHTLDGLRLDSFASRNCRAQFTRTNNFCEERPSQTPSISTPASGAHNRDGSIFSLLHSQKANGQ